MGGMFGVVSRKDCVTDLFFGIDYHSHLGTKKVGLQFMEKTVLTVQFIIFQIHHLELSLKMILKKCLENGDWLYFRQ